MTIWSLVESKSFWLRFYRGPVRDIASIFFVLYLLGGGPVLGQPTLVF
jgi:hypothetical protein